MNQTDQRNADAWYHDSFRTMFSRWVGCYHAIEGKDLKFGYEPSGPFWSPLYRDLRIVRRQVAALLQECQKKHTWRPEWFRRPECGFWPPFAHWDEADLPEHATEHDYRQAFFKLGLQWLAVEDALQYKDSEDGYARDSLLWSPLYHDVRIFQRYARRTFQEKFTWLTHPVFYMCAKCSAGNLANENKGCPRCCWRCKVILPLTNDPCWETEQGPPCEVLTDGY